MPARILPRDEFAESRPLEKQVWAGAIDTVGDKVLAKVLAQMNYGGCVAACGLAGGFTLPTTVHAILFCVMSVYRGWIQ
ncbi:putative zinc-binding dehydrogenase [Escherichia coli]|uniref:Putative zinc-binding dehydrogenase n=1 Tax=Escherichia coli TaxID=562 RepID=A0A377DB45_ECOLX|nr:putative zinc-binding dehydrogenase [Escherichia coli]